MNAGALDVTRAVTSPTAVDVVDAQLHIKGGMIDATLEAMDAVGVASVLIDEFWGTWGGKHPAHIDPGYRVGERAWRAAWPTAEHASILHPDRFSFLVRIDHRDPELETVMRFVGSSPHARAFRLQPVWTLAEMQDFADGGYNHLFDIAADVGLPLFLFVPGYAELVDPYARRHPDLTFVIDHCGMGFDKIPVDGRPAQGRDTRDPAYFDTVLRLAECPNVALKWAHTQDRFGAVTYPYPKLRPILRSAIEAFGADRLLWASDKSVIAGHTWGDLLNCVKENPDLSEDELRWILGRSARKILKWPQPESDSAPN